MTKSEDSNQKLERLYRQLGREARLELILEFKEQLATLDNKLKDTRLDWAKLRLLETVLEPDELPEQGKEEQEALLKEIENLEEYIKQLQGRLKKVQDYIPD